MPPVISAVVPTRNRPDKLRRTIECLRQQTLPHAAYEVVIVDDGSEPQVRNEWTGESLVLRILRLTHSERSVARNRGAEHASGAVVAFVDDDVQVSPVFLQAHVDAQEDWPGALAVGPVSLPDSVLATPFGRFRVQLERDGIPEERGPVATPNLCSATNMSLNRRRFLHLGGFDQNFVSAEDQDLALRHSKRGGRIVFIPEATALHDDDNLDIRTYCRRSEWGAARMIPFWRRHNELPDNQLRSEINRPIRWRGDSPRLLLRKSLKAALAWGPALETLFAITSLVERVSSSNTDLSFLYRLLLGVHLQRGFRRGWGAAEGEQRSGATRS
jgi:glycosyltransferase involved in cell wall biosynthesis